MSTVITCLLIVMMMPQVCAWIGGYLRYQQCGGIDNKHPRLQVAKLEGSAHRAYAAQQNCWEALGMFSAALLAVQLRGLGLDSVATLCLAFVAARTVFIVCYLANIDAVRSLSFIIGLGICLTLFYKALAG